MKRRSRYYSKRPFIKEAVDTTDQNVIETLKKAWNNLPDDITTDERLIFIELIEKTIKMHHTLRSVYHKEEKNLKN